MKTRMEEGLPAMGCLGLLLVVCRPMTAVFDTCGGRHNSDSTDARD
jgi:hypothetical protein